MRLDIGMGWGERQTCRDGMDGGCGGLGFDTSGWKSRLCRCLSCAEQLQGHYAQTGSGRIHGQLECY